MLIQHPQCMVQAGINLRRALDRVAILPIRLELYKRSLEDKRCRDAKHLLGGDWLWVVAVVLLVHLMRVGNWQREGKLLMSAFLFGSAVESFLLQLGVLDFDAPRQLIPLKGEAECSRRSSRTSRRSSSSFCFW